MCLEAGPFLFGAPEEYARGKAAEFPDEGGPVILVVDVPQDINERDPGSVSPYGGEGELKVGVDPATGRIHLSMVFSRSIT